MKFLKPGKVVLVLQGKHAGKKAVIVKNYDDGHGKRKYPFCLVAGIQQYPKRITKDMPQKKIAKRSVVKPFVKVVNYNHVMPTRYNLDVDVKVTLDQAADPTLLKECKKNIKTQFEQRYNSGKNKWFFEKLRF
jgi:large subunit ribosomal protein L27e